MTQKPTPGPYNAQGNEVYAVNPDNGIEFLIGEVENPNLPYRENCATATLFAASFEMLAALKHADLVIDNLIAKMGLELSDFDRERKAAIAKAEGGA